MEAERYYPRIAPLAQVLAQVVHFARDDYNPKQSDGGMPREGEWNLGYVCSCFLAQHTLRGGEGVDTEFGFRRMKVDKDVPFEERVKLAEAAIAELGGERPE